MNIKIEIEYIGTNYCGWQKQRNSLTIQQILEDIIFKLTDEKVIIIGSGRTDSGVHAKSQVANFTLQKKINLQGLKMNLNKLLPNDIKIKKCKKVSDNFHSQFSSLQKTYLYKIKSKNNPSVFERGKISCVMRALNSKIPSFSEIGIPESVQQLLKRPRGLLLVTGPTGCGKTTTIASAIDWLNENKSSHILTIEDPIEFVFKNKNCLMVLCCSVL